MLDNYYTEGGNMIQLIKRFWKYLLVVFSIVIILSIYFYKSNSKVATSNVNKLSEPKKDEITKKGNDNETNDYETVFVDVKGAVNAPGVYEIDKERRVIDAINLAGGLKEGANTINLNLSKKVSDEMYIVVYTQKQIDNYKKNNSSEKITCASNECICPDNLNDACLKTDSNETSLNGKISINTANKQELMSLSGIGEAKAESIIKYRNENGNFNSIEDIKNISGIGDSIYEKIKDKITL